jgi:hypothetical protein
VPVLPRADDYLYLARDFRFGIIGNCVDRTVCVFGQELLDAFGDLRPSVFRRPTWTFEERRAMERQWAECGWQRLTLTEREKTWERFDAHFEFSRRRGRPGSHGIAEPTPSLTWTLASVAARHVAEAADLTRKVLAGLRKATRPGERLYALDALRWYEYYTFDPGRLDSAGRDCWALPMYPDDSYAIFLAPDFRFGVFGDPLERTFCVFGQELLEAMSHDLPSLFGRVVRQDGAAVSLWCEGCPGHSPSGRSVMARLRKYVLSSKFLTDQITEEEYRTLMGLSP